jgi:ferric-dicitrate binding protein FerR (iron transport regulator)
MEKDKLISFIASNQSFDDYPEVIEWINTTEKNKEDYIRYKNLWAIMQHGYDIPKDKIQEALSMIRKKPNQKKQSLRLWNLTKYAALVVVVLLCGYLIGDRDLNNEITMNEVFVPNGNRSSVVLPDGSKVWINNGTKLIYPEEFKGKNRIVELEGEGFFNVTHDKTHPFIVKIGQNRIKVLGTKFAVVAYPNDQLIKTELISGQIQFDVKERNQTNKFHSCLMKPSQSLTFDKSSGKLSQSRIADSFYNYWLNGVYEFRNETFVELARKIERIYNVQVTFEEEILKKRLFSGTLSINDNIYTLMEVFKRASGEPFIYTHEGNHIYIGRKIE